MRLLSLVSLLFCCAAGLLAQRNANADSRRSSPSGMRNAGWTRQGSQRIAPASAEKLGRLIGVSAPEFVDQYLTDGETCAIRLDSYAALRLAEKNRSGLRRKEILTEMCKQGTNSFGRFLTQPGGLAMPKAGAEAQAGAEAEKQYLREVDQALKK